MWLRSLVARRLNIDEHEVATDQPLGELGIDSLTAAEFSLEIEEHTGVNAPLERFLGEHTLEDIAEDIARELADLGPATETNPATAVTA